MGKLGKVFHSSEGVRKERAEKDKEYENGLPQYLIDFYDEKEFQQLNQEYFKEKAKNIKNIPKKERVEYIQKRNEEFWEENRAEIIRKKPLRSDLKTVYKEPDRNKENFEQERDLTEEERIAIIALCEKNIYLFACRYFGHLLKKPSSKFHKYLYQLINDKFGNLKKRLRGFKHALAAPRGSAKSTLVSCILPIWCACYKKKKFIMLLSDTASQSEDFLMDVKRELEGNLLLQRDFPDVCGQGTIWRASEILTKNVVRIMAFGTGSRIRGRKIGASRPDLIIGDDLENSDIVRSQTTRDFIRYHWFNKDVLHLGERGGVTDFLIVGTILGQASLLNALIDAEEYPDWSHRKFQAVEKFSNSDLWFKWEKLFKDRFDLNRKETALAFFKDNEEEMLRGIKILWPEGDTYYDLMIIKLSDYSGFLSEHQNDPIDTTKILVTKDQLHFENFSKNPRMLKIIRNPSNLWYGALDPSLGKTATSDYPCIVTLVRDIKTGFLLVVDVFLKRRSVDDQIKEIINKHDKYRYSKFGIEVNAFQVVLADNLRRFSRKEGLYVPIKELKNYREKVMRIDSIIPVIKDGTVIFDTNKYNSNQQYALGIDMLTTYVGDGSEKYDDFPDCLEMCIRVATGNKFKMLVKSNR